MSLNKKQYSIDVGGKTLALEFSDLANQTNASVLAKCGETVVLTSVVMSKRDAATDYLPLKVDYEERFYAAGKIIGSRFIRREGRPSEEAILTGRLVDRTIRPLFDHRLRRDIQVVVTVLAYDEENDPDFVGLMAASSALSVSDVPWNGPVAGVRIAKIRDNFVTNPSNSDIRKPETIFETFVSGGKGLINMIELGGREAKEGEIVEAFQSAQKEIERLTEFQKTIVKEIGKPKQEVKLAEPDPELKAAVDEFLSERLEAAVYERDKVKQHENLGRLKDELFLYVKEKSSDEQPAIGAAEFLFEEALDALVHRNILEREKRPDGRRLDEVRSLEAEVGLFERTHGSGIFVRGDTQALAVTTLAPPGAEQLIETMEVTAKRRFLLHYNFPPYSVGEIGTFRGPGRREIGHGALAEKALRPLIPPAEEFPYTIRVVSEILSSNGSSSMATVCAAVLSLMDAGVPVKKPAAGIAMGIMIDPEPRIQNSEEPSYKILTDIQGPEDHYGDMDFKVAGTEDGVNALQMDVKVHGVSIKMIREGLEQAKKARLEILKFMGSVIDEPRAQLSPHAPIVLQLKINPEKIGAVIGPGGKIINGLIRKLGLASIDIEEDGRVYVSAARIEKAREAIEEIKMLTREFKVGDVVEGRVLKNLDFGAVVDLGGGQDGMAHISELKNGFVKTVDEVVKVGDFVRAKVIRVDADGRIGLSLKQL